MEIQVFFRVSQYNDLYSIYWHKLYPHLYYATSKMMVTLKERTLRPQRSEIELEHAETRRYY